jgi:hypothetical protein
MTKGKIIIGIIESYAEEFYFFIPMKTRRILII